MKLNPQQRAAVDRPHDEPVAVVAGAGTGKTQLLTARFVRLCQAGLAPERILCLTFTRKAALNMRRRILEALRTADRPVPAPERLWISTFHGTAWRILTDDLLRARLAPDTRLLTAGEADALRDRVWNAICHDYPAGVAATEGRLWEQPGDVSTAAFATVGRLLMDGIAPAAVPNALHEKRAQAYEAFEAHLRERLDARQRFAGRADYVRALDGLADHARAEAATAQLLQAVGETYDRALADARALDFTGVLLRATAICEEDHRWRERFDTVLVDECQDTSGAQFRLLRALARPGLANVTIVGDRKQSIYSFQGARPENTAELDVPTVDLTLNYRSVGEILDAAHDVIRATMPDEPRLEPERRKHANAPRVWFARLADEAAEAAWIAVEVRALHDAGVPFAHVMVLVRNRSRFPAIATALETARIPHDVLNTQVGWQREILKTALALLRVAVDPLDDLALVRLLQETPVAMPDADLYALLCGRDGYAIEALRGNETLRERYETIEELTAAVHTMPGAEFVSYAIRRWGLLDVALRRDDARRADFRALAQLYAAAARAFSAVPAPTMRAFIDGLRAGRIDMAPDQAIDAAAARDAVRVCNVHQVKGLEFPIVFIAGLGHGRFPDLKTMDDPFCYDDHLGFAQRETWDRDRIGRWQLDLKDRWRARKLEEEQRLLYVAMTRAQHRLYLTTSTRPPKPEKLDEPQYFVERFEQRIRRGLSGAAALAPEERAPAAAAEVAEMIAESPPPATASRTTPPNLDARIAAANARIAWRPTPAQPHTVTASFTRIAAYLDCPRLYKFRYHDRVPAFDGRIAEIDEPPAPATNYIAPATFGTVLHRALELFHAKESLAHGNAARAVDSAVAETPGASHAYRAEARCVVERYAGWAIAKAPVVACEESFVLHLPAQNGAPAIRVRGSIDRIDRDGEGYAIWDYKTGAAPPAELAAKYAHQLRLYAHAARRVLGKHPVVRAGVIALSAQDEAEAVVDRVDVGMDAVDETLRAIRNAATGIARGAFTVDEQLHAERPCRYCEYRAWCDDAKEGM